VAKLHLLQRLHTVWHTTQPSKKGRCSHKLNVSFQHLTVTIQAAARPSNKHKGKAGNARDGRTEVLSVLSNKTAVAADALRRKIFFADKLQGRSRFDRTSMQL